MAHSRQWISSGVWLMVLAGTVSAQPPRPDARIQLAFIPAEAEAVLGILDKRAAAQPVLDADWQRLFSTVPYTRLKKREAALHRDFTDDEFKAFVLSPELAKKTEELRRTLEAWKSADLKAAANRILPYLPTQARIRASVFPMIKPKPNSFVYEPSTDPAVFLYLDPAISPAVFENTVAHEMHHIGFSSIEGEMDAHLKELPPPAKAVAEWIGAFGEGFAMLAAAGGPDIHPHAASPEADRARWDRDMANFNADLKTVEAFFLEVLHQKLKTKEAINTKAFSFFGVQGPWYTVGYRMAVVIEKRFGRPALVDCMVDLRKLLPLYNRAAVELNQKSAAPLALWSKELVDALEPQRPQPGPTLGAKPEHLSAQGGHRSPIEARPSAP